jgi:hypothetical protein
MAGGMSRGLILRCLRSRFRRAPTSAYCSQASQPKGPARLLRLSVSACLSTSQTRALKVAGACPQASRQPRGQARLRKRSGVSAYLRTQ